MTSRDTSEDQFLHDLLQHSPEGAGGEGGHDRGRLGGSLVRGNDSEEPEEVSPIEIARLKNIFCSTTFAVCGKSVEPGRKSIPIPGMFKTLRNPFDINSNSSLAFSFSNRTVSFKNRTDSFKSCTSSCNDATSPASSSIRVGVNSNQSSSSFFRFLPPPAERRLRPAQVQMSSPVPFLPFQNGSTQCLLHLFRAGQKKVIRDRKKS